MKIGVLENININDRVVLYTIKGDMIQGAITMIDDNKEIIGLRKDTDSRESRYSYALIAGCDIIEQSLPQPEQQSQPQSQSQPVATALNDKKILSEEVNFADVVQIALEQGIADLPEWGKIVSKYRYAAKVGEFAKKHNRIGPILAELSLIKQNFSNQSQYNQVYNFFASLEDKMENSISAAKKVKQDNGTTQSASNIPVKTNEPLSKSDVSKQSAHSGDAVTHKAETPKTSITARSANSNNTSSLEKTGVVFIAKPDEHNSKKCFRWAVRADSGETYNFSERNIEDVRLLNSLTEKFSKGIQPNEKVRFQVLRINGRYGETLFANRVRYNVNANVNLGVEYQDALKKFSSGKDYDSDVLPVFLEYFEKRPIKQTANIICSIYMRSGEPIKTIEFVETENAKTCLTAEERLNLKYEAYWKMADINNAVEAQKKIIEITKNSASKAHHLTYIIHHTYLMKDYAETLRYCEKWLETDTGKSIPTSDTRVVRLVRYAAESIIRLRESGKTPVLSRHLESIIQSDEHANAILTGNTPVPDNTVLSSGFSGYDDIGEFSLPPELDNLGELSKGLMYSLDVSKPPIVIPHIVAIEKNKFSGSFKQADRIVSAVTTKYKSDISSKNPNDRYERCLYSARILLDTIATRYNTNQIAWYPDKEIDNIIERMYGLLTKAFASKGDYILLSKPDESHSSRLYYIESIKYAKGINDQDMQNAVVRCILSVFVDNEFIQEIMRQRGGENVSIGKIVDYFDMDTQYAKIDIKLLLGVFVRIIANNSDLRNGIQQALLEAVSKAKHSSDIAQELFISIGKELPGNLTKHLFNKKAIDEFRQFYFDNERDFISFTNRNRNMCFQREWIEDARKDLHSMEKFFDYVDAYDKKNCYEFINDLLKLMEDVYHFAGIFNEQETALKSIKEQIGRRIQEIKETPSYYSYRYIITMFQKWLDITGQTLGDLYFKNPPKIITEIASSNMLILNEDDTVEIDMFVRNEGGQSADSVRVQISVGDDSAFELVSINEGPSRTIKGGDKKDVSVVLGIKDKRVKAFPVSVQVDYGYKGLNDEILNDTYKNEIEVSFGENHRIDMDNPYNKEVEASGMRNRSMMYGRDTMLTKYIELLQGTGEAPIKSKTLLFYGQRRAGKTTVLQFLTEDLKNEVFNAVIVEIGDILQIKPDGVQSFEAVLYKWLFKEIDNDINNRHPQLKDAMEACGIDIPAGSESFSAADWRYAANNFFTKFYKLTESNEKFTKIRIVVLIDEFTRLYGWIKDGLVDRDFMQHWKVMIQKYGIVAVVVAQDYVEEFANAFPNAFGAIEEIQVDYLKLADVRKMVTEPFAKIAPWGAFQDKYVDETIERIMELTAGSAYFTMIFLDRLVRYMNDNNRPYVIRRTVDMVLQDEILGGNDPLSVAKFDSLYNDGDNDNAPNRKAHNLAVLWRIALYQDERKCSCPKSDIQIPDGIDACSELTSARIGELVDKLYKRGVLLREDGRDEYKIRVGMFKEWLIKKCSVDTINSLLKYDQAEERL